MFSLSVYLVLSVKLPFYASVCPSVLVFVCQSMYLFVVPLHVLNWLSVFRHFLVSFCISWILFHPIHTIVLVVFFFCVCVCHSMYRFVVLCPIFLDMSVIGHFFPSLCLSLSLILCLAVYRSVSVLLYVCQSTLYMVENLLS